MKTKDMTSHRGRIRGSANGARIIGLVLWFPIAGITLASLVSPGYTPSLWAIFFTIATPLLLVWPWFMGVKLSGDRIVIVAWYWIYRVPIADIENITWWSYSGVLNRGGDDSGWDPLQLWTMSLMITRKGRKERGYPSTIGSRKRLMLIVHELRKAASLPVSDPSGSDSKRHLSTTRHPKWDFKWFWQREPFASLFRKDN